VVLPIYQEQAAIQGTIPQLCAILKETGLIYEVIAVDDGSTDETGKVLGELKGQFPAHLRVITHPYNKGNGAAVKTGIRAARGEFIACMDADGQHDPEDLLKMLPHTAEFDLVVGARTSDYRGGWHRNLANRIYNALGSWLAEFPIKDLTSGFRIFRAEAIKKYVDLLPAQFSYPTTSTLIFIKAGYNLKFVPINAQPRKSGASKINLVGDGWRFFLIIFKIVVIFEPLRVFMPVALVSFALAILSTLYSTWTLQRLFIPNSGVVLFMLGVLVMLLGLIAEQIAALQISIKSND
jgi:glycosyltransferase involved in cell wall biosynthesis